MSIISKSALGVSPFDRRGSAPTGHGHRLKSWWNWISEGADAVNQYVHQVTIMEDFRPRTAGKNSQAHPPRTRRYG